MRGFEELLQWPTELLYEAEHHHHYPLQRKSTARHESNEAGVVFNGYRDLKAGSPTWEGGAKGQVGSDSGYGVGEPSAKAG